MKAKGKNAGTEVFFFFLKSSYRPLGREFPLTRHLNCGCNLAQFFYSTDLRSETQVGSDLPGSGHHWQP